jgi:hypothetical protein
MTSEDYYAYQETISNLIILKIFWDLGASLKGLEHRVYPGGYNDGNGVFLLYKGLSKLYKEADYTQVPYEDHKLNELLKDIFDDPETVYIVKDPLFEKAWKQLDEKQVLQIVETEGETGFGTWYEFKMMDTGEGYFINCQEYLWGHEMAEHVSDIHKRLSELLKQLPLESEE